MEDSPTTCGGCGAGVAEVPLTWTWLRSERGAVWLCEDCTLWELRSIEARLDPGWGK